MWITFREKPRRPVITGREGRQRKVDKLEVGIYIKSRFRGNPRGEGEAAAAIEYIDRAGKSHIRIRKEQVGLGTRNALILKACIDALRILVRPCHATVYTDCGYIRDACRQGWPGKWQQDGWRKADGKPPANLEEWKQLCMLMRIHTVAFTEYDGRHDRELERALGNGDSDT